MVYWFFKCLEAIGKIAINAYLKLVFYYDRLKGEKSLSVISISDDSEPAYTLHTSEDGIIRLYCIETIYELSHTAWWCSKEHHRSYKVCGVCEGPIPEGLVCLISKGITIGAMLPDVLPSELQRKEAIHVYATLLLSELKKKQKNK